MILDALDPFATELRLRSFAEDHAVLDWNPCLVVVAVANPDTERLAAELALVHLQVEWVAVMVVLVEHYVQRAFEGLSRSRRTHRSNSMPSDAISTSASSTCCVSFEAASTIGLVLFKWM